MVDDSTHETSTGDAAFSRRSYLLAAGGLGIGLAGYAGYRRHREGRPNDGDPSSTGEPPGRREDFLWLGGSLWRDEAVRDNLFAFARRHDLAVVLVGTHSNSGEDPLAERFRPSLESASEFDLEVWLNVGLLTDLTAEEFVTDDDAREAHLERLRDVIRAHDDVFDSGRVICWQEAPVMGEWADGGEWNEAAVQNLVTHGPEIFAAQKRAIEAVTDALEVGLFVHFPYVVDSKRPEVLEELARGLRNRGVEPDFGFSDFYRGWYEKDVGPEPANDAVRSLVSNLRDALDRPAFYLGQSHTINPNHTPSKQALRMNLRASIDAGAAGVGWYVRTGYHQTESGFDPFVPNLEGAELDGDSINTLTIARDRALYPWLATLERQADFDAAERFDLWVIGDGFDFHDHRLSVRVAGGDADRTGTDDGDGNGDWDRDWEYVGDFGGDADGDYPDDSTITDRATVFRALDRDLLADGSLECRVETVDGSAGADLLAAFAMPCDPAAYVTEREAATFALEDDDAPLEDVCLGAADERTALAPGETRRIAIPVDGDGGSLRRLRHPDHVDAIRDLESFEAEHDVDPSARFDLWLRGSDLEESDALPSILDADGTAHAPADVGFVTSTDSVALCYGLERERFLSGDGIELADDEGGADAAAVEEAYAMPYAGSATFRTPTRAAELLDAQPDEAAIFSLEYVTLE